MGDIFGGRQKTTTKTNMGPWGPQQPYITDAFREAQNTYRSKAGTPFYEGPLHAGLDPMTGRAIDLTGDYATGRGAMLADGTGSVAANLLGLDDSFMGALDAYAGSAGVDPVEANLAAAGRYADNPQIDGMIDAASRDVVRNLSEDVLPGINRDAVATGNINSSRTGVAEGIARRGAEDRIADISASFRGAAFDRGLELAEGSRRFNTDSMGRAASMFGDALDLGRGFSGSASDLAYTNLGNLQKAGMVRQGDAQGQMDADYARWQGQDLRPSDLLARYYGIVGANQWGQEGTTTQKTSGGPGLVGGLIGTAATVAGLGGLGGIGRAAGIGSQPFMPSIGPSLLSPGFGSGPLVDLRGFRV